MIRKKLFVIILLTLLPMVASARTIEIKIDGIYYELDLSTKTASVISGNNVYSGDIIIPETVTLWNEVYNVTSIEGGAFIDCNGLSSVAIPNSVTSIGRAAFAYCTGLSSITIPNSVTSIGFGAFGGCTGLTSFTIPNSITTIEEKTFYGCTGLTSIIIPNSVTSIRYQAFSGCSGLASVIIGKSVTSIDLAFRYCNSLTFVEFHCKEIENWFEGSTFNQIVIGEEVTNIGQGAFSDCSSLTSIIIGNSVTNIGNDAFYGCSSLTSITIPNSVTSIGESTFYKCSGLTSITIPNSVTSIGRYAFEGCEGLTSITIPNSVTSIGDWAFSSCRSLTSVIIGNSVTSIGKYSFMDCSGLKDVYCLATEVPKTGYSPFYNILITSISLHVPLGCKEKYAAVGPWKSFKEIVEFTEVPDPVSLGIKLTATEKNGVVRLQFNSVPNDTDYRITRTDANGAKDIHPFYESHYPDYIEYVDAPPAGTYTYQVGLGYLDADGKRQVAKDEVKVTVAKAIDQATVAIDYGTIMGRIECDKKPPVSGLKVTFDDNGSTVNARGTIFQRYSVPLGTEVTMTVSGDDAHNYETAKVKVVAGINSVTIKGTLKKDYEPNEQEHDLKMKPDQEFYVKDGKHHLKFTLLNPNEEHIWEGSVIAILERRDGLPQHQKWRGGKLSHRGEVSGIRMLEGKTKEIDIVFDDMVVPTETVFKLCLTSKGKWAGSKEPEKEKSIITTTLYDMVEYEIRIPSTQSGDLSRWNDNAQEKFACLMLALSSLTPGMDGMVGNLKPYEQKVLSVVGGYDAAKQVMEWLGGKTALDAINDPNLFNITSAIENVNKELKDMFTETLVEKYYKNIVGNVAELAKAEEMLEGMKSLYSMVTEDAGTHEGSFGVSMACASMLYQLASNGNAVPLTSMLKTYQVVGESLINSARHLGEIMNSSYILSRLKANKPYTGDEEGQVNTAVDFKLVVNRETWTGNTKPINFKNKDAMKQIDNICIKTGLGMGTKPAVFTFTLVPKKDCLMLKSDGRGITDGMYLDENKLDIDEYNTIKVLYMEINWRNGRQTIIPLGESTNGVEINKNNTTIQTLEFEKYKPLDYTVTLTTTTGTDHIADELYIGSNKNRK